MLGRVDCRAIAAFDGSARLIWASPRAAGLLARYLGKRRTLPPALALAIARLGALAGGRIPPATDLEVDVRGRLRISLRLARVPESKQVLVVAQLRAADADAVAGAEPFARSLCLAAAECAVAAALALARGLGNKGIAQQLFISPHAVRTHLRHIFDKLGVHTRVDAVLALQRAAAGVY